jgi:hypothetical protein
MELMFDVPDTADAGNLVTDTLKFLDSGKPMLVRMETLRSAFT